MLTVTFNAQHNTITVEDTEKLTDRNAILENCFPCDGLNYCQSSTVDVISVASVQLTDVDFEGFVFTLVDKNGNRWSTEIIQDTLIHG